MHFATPGMDRGRQGASSCELVYIFPSLSVPAAYQRQIQEEEGGGEGMEWEVGVSRCKLLNEEWKHNAVLLCSAQNCIQDPRMNHDGKEFLKRMYTYG